MRRLIFAFVLLAGCSPSSLEDFHHEGESLTRRLLKECREIQSREELLASLPLLKKHFENLVTCMIEARKYQDAHPEDDYEVAADTLGEALRSEMQRLYALEGGREFIEKTQREALLRLDAFERTLSGQKSRIK